MPDINPYLSPLNVAQQFIAGSDDLAREVVWLCIRECLLGRLNPETADAPTLIREIWKRAIFQTTDHQRDPYHGTRN